MWKKKNNEKIQHWYHSIKFKMTRIMEDICTSV